MADSAVPITAGSGTSIDTRTEDVNGQHRQVMVLGDPSANAGVAAVGNATPAVGAYGLTAREPVVSTFHRVAAGSGDAVSIKAAPGTLKSVHASSKAAIQLFAKFHNTAGAPTPGTGVVFAVGVQAGLPRDLVLPGGGRAFTTGIAMTIVTGLADADATGVTAGDIVIEVCYE